MRTTFLVWGVLGIGACDGTSQPDCTEFNDFEAFDDADQDGFGADSAGRVCRLEANMVKVAGDCNDQDPAIFPGAEELCNGFDDDCAAGIDDGYELHQYWNDDDRDGFGSRYPSILACEKSSDAWVRNSDDCDDANPSRHPDAVEVCNDGIDDDCDTLSDEADPDLDVSTKIRFHEDTDADGYGNPSRAVDACQAPTGMVEDGTDCNDAQGAVHPGANEICNDGVDDDCDMLRDDEDPTLDPASLLSWYDDVDGDGYGNQTVVYMGCAPGAPTQVANDLDCNDADFLVNPGVNEIICDLVENDCDPFTTDNVDTDFDGFMACDDDCNDHDSAISPIATEVIGDAVDQDCDGFESCYTDFDADGLRTDETIDVSVDQYCAQYPNAREDLPIDCDDTNAAINWTGNWLYDFDEDGVGIGVAALVTCIDPGPSFAPEETGQDCNDFDPAYNPLAIDPCDDGFDFNCDGTDTCLTCKDVMEAGATVNGAYTIKPLGIARSVYCDFTTDDGGWTLTAASAGSGPWDQAGPYDDQLQDLTPSKSHREIWDGLRQRVQTNSDIRFSCTKVFGGVMETDVSFYDTGWYMEVTTGTDADSCFNEMDGAGADTPPARRDNLTGRFRPYGDVYSAGYLEGEDRCDDTGGFAIDFDDRGIKGVLFDGTNWGTSQGRPQCDDGRNPVSGFFIWVRELD